MVVSTMLIPCARVAMAGPVAPAPRTITAPTRDSVSCPANSTADTLWFTSVAPTATGTGCESSMYSP